MIAKALILALVALAILGSLQSVGERLELTFCHVSQGFEPGHICKDTVK